MSNCDLGNEQYDRFLLYTAIDFQTEVSSPISALANRGQDLDILSHDKALLFLNNGTLTYSSHSYNTTDALNLTISNPDLFPYCSWKVVDYVGSGHYPILIELDYDVKAYGSNNIFWNFKKANWTLFEKNQIEQLQKNPITEDLENEWRATGRITPNPLAISQKPNKIQPQVENTNSIIGINGTPTVNDKETADALGNNYSKESKLVLERENKKTGRATTRKLIRFFQGFN
ncbi:RNA-directed DNA polymerase from mobile element jockey [Caerostris extrusa]|uniref:RNA-directed DNA polymerase from mobile element jockey n=1 Tax=Caerostris extrusa TaxID=172846 RepID=A0AAV4YG12_CAEEX|nr:RNA-directed DNA polymerase from mobile element jockey [Caerostris extrusa]